LFPPAVQPDRLGSGPARPNQLFFLPESGVCPPSELPPRGWHRVASQDRRLSVMLPNGGSVWDAKNGIPDTAGHVGTGDWETDNADVSMHFDWVPEVGRHEGVCTIDTQAGRMEVMMWYGHYATIVAWHFYA
jgi:hypothetical protein